MVWRVQKQIACTAGLLLLGDLPPFHALEAAKHGIQRSPRFIAKGSVELGSTPRPLVHRSPPSSHSGVNASSVGVGLLVVTVLYIPQEEACVYRH